MSGTCHMNILRAISYSQMVHLSMEHDVNIDLLYHRTSKSSMIEKVESTESATHMLSSQAVAYVQ